ncbi:hypothetical protein IQ249_11225 [Lusitaniella coriacea LEGE 07157]|uniref:Uncharacterized protein n=1 Tax=Lusitaniella coriacea LEGE 07157 TaxID=945747 RepID=A0A8J7DZ92_9CYAN|nr:hypothetical protein [Lusitaniella coriacea]MBE9116471.1 hypothetical protein [Lusitaniella coriacea LEGE 07157]
MKAIPIGDLFNAHDIWDVLYTRTGFRVVAVGILPASEEYAHLELFLPDVEGFRCLDEGNLLRYWASEQFKTGHAVYQIESEGWLDEKRTEWISITNCCQEYFVTTENECISVLSYSTPIMRVYEDPYPPE